MTTNGRTAASVQSNGAKPAVGPPRQPGGLLRYLPAIYWGDDFVGRFLQIFEEVLSPIQEVVSRRTLQFEPSVASPPMLEALASWVGVDPIQLPQERTRLMVKNALLLHRWRGTKTGLRLALEIATGQRPLITEFSPGLVLGADASLGLNTSLADGQPLQVYITFNCAENQIDLPLVHDIIRRYKPAPASYMVAFPPQ